MQVNAAATVPKCGTGLGLSIVRQIVGRLHGEVNFAPAPGGGTVFSVTLPSWERELQDSGAQQQITGRDLG